MWIEHRGENGVPNDVRTLIDDAEDIKDTLLSVAEQLEGIDKEKRSYTVTIAISNGEEENTLTFETVALSLEEATEKILRRNNHNETHNKTAQNPIFPLP